MLKKKIKESQQIVEKDQKHKDILNVMFTEIKCQTDLIYEIGYLQNSG